MRDSEIKNTVNHEGSITMSREKVTAEERIEAAKACAEGRISQSEAARRLGVDKSSVRGWIARYKAGGVMAFKEQEHNTVYSDEIKASAEFRSNRFQKYSFSEYCDRLHDGD